MFGRGKGTLWLTVDCITSAEIRRVGRTYVYSPQGNYVHKIFRDSNETAQTIAMCRQFEGLKKKKESRLPYKSFASFPAIFVTHQPTKCSSALMDKKGKASSRRAPHSFDSLFFFFYYYYYDYLFIARFNLFLPWSLLGKNRDLIRLNQ